MPPKKKPKKRKRMPALLSSGNRVGIVESQAIQVTSEFAGQWVTMEVGIPSNQNTVDRSFEFVIEIADTEIGPWDLYGGFTWQGGDVGKDGDSLPAKRWPIDPAIEGKWVRGTFDIPVRMRFSLDFDLSPS